MRPWHMWTLPLLLAVSTMALAQSTTAVTKRNTELRDGPGASARVLSTVPADTALTRLPNRQSAWVEVRTPTGDTGWVHMFDIGAPHAPAAPSNAATGALRGLTNFFTRGNQAAKTTVATSTIGIRGLGAEDIAQAQPNLTALAQAESFRQDAAQAQRFATIARLTAREVQPLPPPASPAQQSQDDPNLR